MTVKSRSKMISFRLSTKEYEEFRDFCMMQGATGSELARAAVNKLIRAPGFSPDDVLSTRVSELEGQLHLLALELKRVKEVTTK